MITRILLIVIFMFFAGADAYGFFSNQTGGYPAEYLYSFSADAKGLALGLGQTALSGRASLIYSNPASIAALFWQEASFSFTPLFEDTQLMTASYGYPFKDRYTLGVGLLRLSSQNAEKTNELGESVSMFSDNETALLFGCGYKLSEGLHLGADIKILSQDIDTYSAKCFGLDAGLIYFYTPEQAWALDLVNLLPATLGDDPLPAVLKIGFLRGLFRRKISVSFDALFIDIFKTRGDFRWYSGVEYCLYDCLALRAGINQKQLSCGFGFNQKLIDINYAFVYHPLDIAHSITLNLRYGFLPTQAEIKVKQDLDELARLKTELAESKKEDRKELEAQKKELAVERRSTVKFLKAYDKYKSGDFQSTKAILNAILSENPDYKDAQALLSEVNSRLDADASAKRLDDARYYYKKGSYAESLKNLEFVLKADPSQQEARVLSLLAQARANIEAKDYKAAKGNLIDSLKIEPGNTEAMELLKRIQNIIDVYEK